jgi:hypothetical protein
VKSSTHFTLLLLIAFLISATFSQSEYSHDYNPQHNQKPDQYTLDMRREELPFKDTINDPHGAFIVTNLNRAAAVESEVQETEKEFAAESYYTTLVPGNDKIVSV